jgi:GUN4-like
VQKRIYESLEGTRKYDEKIWEAFGDRIGWRLNKKWLYYKYLKFNTKAPEAHLPCGGAIASVGGWLYVDWGESWWSKRGVSLLFRVETCKV